MSDTTTETAAPVETQEASAETQSTTESHAKDGEDSSDGSKEAAPKESPKEATPEKRKFKVKVDKDELEVDEDELVRGYQLRQASDKRFKEAAEKTKLAESFIDLLRTNPRAVLRSPEVGQDVRKLAEAWLAEEIAEEAMDPKEKELRDLRKEKAEVERKLKEREEAERSQREAEHVAKYQEEYSNQITTAIKESGLPMNSGIVNRFRDYMLMALENGYEASAKDVVAYVKQDFQNDIKSMFSSGDIGQLLEAIGEEGLKKVREYDVSRLKDPKKSSKVGAKEQPPVKEDRRDPSASVSLNDYFTELNKKFS